MKRALLTTFALLALFLLPACQKELEEMISNLREDVSALETRVSKLNENLTSLSNLVSALEKNEHITGVILHLRRPDRLQNLLHQRQHAVPL